MLIDAYDCTRGLHKHRKRQSALTVDSGRERGKNIVPHRRERERERERERLVPHRKRQSALTVDWERERERERQTDRQTETRAAPEETVCTDS